MVLLLWWGYWVVEIIDQFKKSDTPLQLPYVFLFIVMVVIPYCIYWFSGRRRRLARRASAESYNQLVRDNGRSLDFNLGPWFEQAGDNQ